MARVVGMKHSDFDVKKLKKTLNRFSNQKEILLIEANIDNIKLEDIKYIFIEKSKMTADLYCKIERWQEIVDVEYYLSGDDYLIFKNDKNLFKILERSDFVSYYKLAECESKMFEENNLKSKKIKI